MKLLPRKPTPLNRFTCILLFLAIASVQCLSQKNLDALVFKGAKACSKVASPKSFWFFKGSSNYLSDEMFSIYCKKVIRTFDCDNNPFKILESGDTVYQAVDGYVDFQYTNSYHDSAYAHLSKPFLNKEQVHLYNSIWQLFKAGKFVCLDRNKKTLRIVSINSCANAGQFDRITTYLEKLNVYDKILVVPCGADSHFFKEIRKH